MITNFIALRNNPALVAFRYYVLSFYGHDGIYPLAKYEDGEIVPLTVADVEMAIMHYIKQCSNNVVEWGDGDSIDRERVRVILEYRGFFEESHIPEIDTSRVLHTPITVDDSMAAA